LGDHVLRAIIAEREPRRRAQRLNRVVNVAAAFVRGATQRVILIERIDEAGCVFTPHHGLAEGSEFWMKLPGIGATRCFVVRTEAAETECTFAPRLHVGALDVLRIRAPAVKPAGQRGFGRKTG
jgi:hypothetical protein